MRSSYRMSYLRACLSLATVTDHAPRQFFSPDLEDTKEEKPDIQTEESGSTETPVLPDVPTNEPAEAGQPDAKKRKVESGDEFSNVKPE